MKQNKIKFEGHTGIEITTDKIKLVVITDCGPRIAFFGKKDGNNLLFWDKEKRGRGEWKLMGGHRVWVTRPLADECEDTYRPDNEVCEVKEENNWLVVTGKTDSVLKIAKGIGIKVESENNVNIKNFVINKSDMLYSCGVWGLTCTSYKKGITYAIPLGTDDEWDCFRYVFFKKWGGGHKSSFNDSQIKFTEDLLIIEPQGKETKRMIEAHKGIFAMNIPDENSVFIKKTDYRKNANYPMGCNMAFFIGPDNFMIEMESMSPEVTLKPEESVESYEKWILLEKSFKNWDELSELIKKRKI